jgi:D-tagatose-1,6-bisphosphate aldolase subunit GatZ/KbaZ
MSEDTLDALSIARAHGGTRGITAVCSAHPLVIEAAMLEAVGDDESVLIEATCNQVNHEGGYTGMTPAAFRTEVLRIAERVGLPRARIILGADHLGPSPWRDRPADEAMAQAEAMVTAFAAAGYEKIHLDTSMGCRDEPTSLPDSTTAKRAARLAAIAEQAALRAGTTPRYIVGTEVPTPGGAVEGIAQLLVTKPESALATYEAHKRAFADEKAEAAFERVIALVVQPGVEFGSDDVVVYEPERAQGLVATLAKMPGLVFEAHSTDFQPPKSLGELVRDGFAILKVGPGLTFALREALYALDCMAARLDSSWRHCLMSAMERVMLADPTHWQSHYRGNDAEQHVLRHFGYSDRIRYYWPSSVAQETVERLLGCLEARTIPVTMISQFLPRLYMRVLDGSISRAPSDLLIQAVRDVLLVYRTACRGGSSRNESQLSSV